MWIGVVSDIHSNLGALEVVIEKMREDPKVDLILNLGDIVGYYTKPNEVVALLSEEEGRVESKTVMGNHDFSVVAGVYQERFSSEFLASITQSFLSTSNYDAIELIGWTIKNMKKEIADFIIQDEMMQFKCEGVGFMMMHGAPPNLRGLDSDPINGYLYEVHVNKYKDKIIEFLRENDASVLLTGHTHKYHAVWFRDENKKTFICMNPGSVGQPRDGEPGASFATIQVENGKILDIQHHLLQYNYFRIEQELEREHLPITLADRLKNGT